MDRKEFNFRVWCNTATRMIRYGPDRKAVAKELLTHLEDAYDSQISKGMTPEEAEQKALASMGSATEIAPQLAAIHSPFWGYVLQAAQILLVVLLVLSLIPIWKYASNLNLQDRPGFPDFDVYSSEAYGGDTGRTLLHLSQPDLSFRSDAGTFTATDAALFTASNASGETSTRLYILIRQRDFLPCTEHKEYYTGSFPVTGHFFARDSLGNVYPGIWDQQNSEDPILLTCSVQSGIFSCTHQFWINDFPADAQWVDICYERDGRSYALRIDLTGGDQA